MVEELNGARMIHVDGDFFVAWHGGCQLRMYNLDIEQVNFRTLSSELNCFEDAQKEAVIWLDEIYNPCEDE